MNPQQLKELSLKFKDLAKEVYLDLSEDDHAIIAHGMVPKEIMDAIEEKIRFHTAEQLTGEGKPMEGFPTEEMAKCVKKDIVSECLKQFHVGLLEAARESNQLIA